MPERNSRGSSGFSFEIRVEKGQLCVGETIDLQITWLKKIGCFLLLHRARDRQGKFQEKVRAVKRPIRRNRPFDDISSPPPLPRNAGRALFWMKPCFAQAQNSLASTASWLILRLLQLLHVLRESAQRNVYWLKKQVAN